MLYSLSPMTGMLFGSVSASLSVNPNSNASMMSVSIVPDLSFSGWAEVLPSLLVATISSCVDRSNILFQLTSVAPSVNSGREVLPCCSDSEPGSLLPQSTSMVTLYGSVRDSGTE